MARNAEQRGPSCAILRPLPKRFRPNMPLSQASRTSRPDAGTQMRPGMGQGQCTPAHIPMFGWSQVLSRCCCRVFEQRLLGEAAAVAFYAILAVFPALAALVSLCGVVIDPAEAAERFQGLAGMLPAGSADMVGQVLGRTAAHGGGRLGPGIGLAAAALWSATAAATQLFGALNLAYGEAESRRLLRLTCTALLFAVGAMAFVALALGGVLAVPAALGAQAGKDGSIDQLLRLLRWPVLFAAVFIALAFAYRHGPSRSAHNGAG